MDNEQHLIACCGIDCGRCDARKATLADDDALREQTARLWSRLNGVPIAPSDIHCTGCRCDGAKTVFCSTMCEIRRCVRAKGYATCADCSAMPQCGVVEAIHRNVPDARQNLMKK